MSVIRPISTVSRNVSCVWFIDIYTATANSCTAGNENVLLGIFFVLSGGRRWNFYKNVVLEVIAEKVKLCYLHVKNNPYPKPRPFSSACTVDFL